MIRSYWQHVTTYYWQLNGGIWSNIDGSRTPLLMNSKIQKLMPLSNRLVSTQRWVGVFILHEILKVYGRGSFSCSNSLAKLQTFILGSFVNSNRNSLFQQLLIIKINSCLFPWLHNEVALLSHPSLSLAFQNAHHGSKGGKAYVKLAFSIMFNHVSHNGHNGLYP